MSALLEIRNAELPRDVKAIERLWLNYLTWGNVDPSFRRIGAGRAILESLIVTADQAGYKRIRSDSPDFMTAAHALAIAINDQWRICVRFPAWGTKDFYIEDPDGHIISFGGRVDAG